MVRSIFMFFEHLWRRTFSRRCRNRVGCVHTVFEKQIEKKHVYKCVMCVWFRLSIKGVRCNFELRVAVDLFYPFIGLCLLSAHIITRP